MSVNVSSIMIYKIYRDYEDAERSIQFNHELTTFAQDVIKGIYNNDNLSNIRFSDYKKELEMFCDITDYFCGVNSQKYKNGGKEYAEQVIADMPAEWLERAKQKYSVFEDFRNNHPNTSMVIHKYLNGDEMVSAVFWDKGPIIIEDKDALVSE